MLGSRSFWLERPARRHLDVLTPDHVETSVASAVMGLSWGRAWGRRRSAPGSSASRNATGRLTEEIKIGPRMIGMIEIKVKVLTRL
jgi:hypothetical protein